jgi:hypothetical protein
MNSLCHRKLEFPFPCSSTEPLCQLTRPTGLQCHRAAANSAPCERRKRLSRFIHDRIYFRLMTHSAMPVRSPSRKIGSTHSADSLIKYKIGEDRQQPTRAGGPGSNHQRVGEPLHSRPLRTSSGGNSFLPTSTRPVGVISLAAIVWETPFPLLLAFILQGLNGQSRFSMISAGPVEPAPRARHFMRP